MSDLLLIRHGNFQKRKGVLADPDGALTSEGMKQICKVASWLKYNFLYKDLKCLTSPYLRTLQTASSLSEVLDIDFTVDADLRDFEEKPVEIANRSLQFENLLWPIKEWTDDRKFNNESVIAFVERCVKLHNRLKKANGKYLIVSHTFPCVALAQLAIGKKPEDVVENCEDTLKVVEKYSGRIPQNISDQMVYLGGLKPCSLTWVQGEEPIWFSRVVWE